MRASEPVDFIVKSVSSVALGIKSIELIRADGAAPAPFRAGAHVDVHLGNGLVRSYSLTNTPSDSPDRYVIAVNRDRPSRGGSAFVHDQLSAGDIIPISGPRNNFELVENAPHIIFIAGGIGITPLWCMIQRLEELGRSWEIFYSARTREAMAFREALQELEDSVGGRVHLNFDHETGGRLLDINSIVAAAPAEAHLYCCGPAPMLQSFENDVSSRPAQRAHVEHFTPRGELATEGGYTVVLTRTGRSLAVPSGKTILETLLAAELDIQYSCMEGMCGTCEVKVIEGIPDHRDSVLTPQERSENKTMMICCSGSRTGRLVLDL